MAVNPSLPAGWIKEGMIVRCTTPQAVGLMQVRVVHNNGSISARRARATKDNVVMLDPTCFAPATIEDRILFTLDAANIGEIRKTLPDGKDERQYKIVFLGQDHPATQVIDKLKTLFDKVQSPQNAGNAVIVTVPQSWLDELVVADPVTPAIKAMAEAEAEQIVEAAKKFTPVQADPAVVDWFVRSFTRQGIDMTDVQIAPAHRLNRAMGQDPTYALIWPNTQAYQAAVKAGLHNAAKELRLRDYFANGVMIMVDLPANWTPTFGEVVIADDNSHAFFDKINDGLQAELAAENEADNAPDDKDAVIGELIRERNELLSRNDRLQILNENLRDQVDSLIGHIDAQELRTEDAAEAAEMSTSIQPLTICKEVETVRGISDAALEKCLNDGWEILHIQFGDNASLNVVFVREQSAPTAPTPTRTAAKLIQPVGPTVSYHIPQPETSASALVMNQHESPAINFGTDIASARATLAAMMNDPEVTHEDFYRAVITSRLPKDDKDAYIEQSRQMRVGGKIAAQSARFVRSPFANRPPVFISDAVPAAAEVLS